MTPLVVQGVTSTISVESRDFQNHGTSQNTTTGKIHNNELFRRENENFEIFAELTELHLKIHT